MKKYLSLSLLFLFGVAFSGCTDSSDPVQKQESMQTEKAVSLNDALQTFETRMDRYLLTGKKSNKELEKLHLDFVPILKFKKFEGDKSYNTAALSVGSIVHKLGDLEGEEYDSLLKTLKPSYDKFYAQYGKKQGK